MTPNPNPSPEFDIHETMRLVEYDMLNRRRDGDGFIGERKEVAAIIIALRALSPQTLPAPGEVERLRAALKAACDALTNYADPTGYTDNNGDQYEAHEVSHPGRLAICTLAQIDALLDPEATPTLATVAAANDEAWPPDAVHELGAWVQKKGRASWRGRIVGWYRTNITALGYAVESAYEPGSVQIYPETALLPLDPAAIRLLSQGGRK